MTRDITTEGCKESTESTAKHDSQRSADSARRDVKSPASSLNASDNTYRRNESAAPTYSASSQQTDGSILPTDSIDPALQEDVSPLLLDAKAAVITRFDLDSRFGPASGIPRLERWERALRFGLSPPIRIRETLLRLAQVEGASIKEKR